MSTQSQVSDRIEPRRVPVSTHSSSHTAVWLIFLIGISFLGRVAALGTRSFWLDEAASSMLARVDWHCFVTAVAHRQANMALYYLLLRGWVQLGNSEWWTRFLSVIFGVAAIPVMYQLGKLALGPKCGRIAALLLAVNAFHIQYSQEARGYSLALFLALLSCYFFLKSVDSPARHTSIAHAVTSVLMVYTQVLGALLVVSQWAYALYLWSTRKTGKRPLSRFVTIAGLMAPVFFILFFKSDRSQLAWMNQSSAATPGSVLLDFSGNAGSLLLMLEMALLVGSAFFYFKQNDSRSVRRRQPNSFFWLWALLPLVVLGAISLRWHVLQTRYLIVCLPAFLLLVADGLAHITPRVAFVAASVAVAGLSIVGVTSYFRSRTDLNHSDNWRDASRYILSEVQPGDVVLFPYSAEEIAFREYQNRFAARRQSLILVPQQTDLELLNRPGEWMPQQLADNTASLHPRVWIISALQPNSRSRAIEAAVGAHLEALELRHFGFVTVQLFSGKTASAP